MCQSIQSNGALMAINPYHSARMGLILLQFNLLSKSNSRMISKDHASLAQFLNKLATLKVVLSNATMHSTRQRRMRVSSLRAIINSQRNLYGERLF